MTHNVALEKRYQLWFDKDIGFVGATDQKPVTAQIISSTLERFDQAQLETPVFGQGKHIRLLDIGCATGVLGRMVGEELSQQFQKPVDYLGMDVNPHLKNAVLDMVKGPAFEKTEFRSGGPELLNQLSYHPDVLLFSHVCYYPDKGQPISEGATSVNSPLHTMLLDTVMNMPSSSMALFVHQIQSDFDDIKKKYAAHVEAETGGNLQSLFKPGLSSCAKELQFTSHLYFPHLEDTEWNRLHQAEPYDRETNPYGDNKKLLNARILAEFMIHKPLESLSPQDRTGYLDMLKETVNKNPLVSTSPYAKFGPSHEMSTINQLILRVHHRNTNMQQTLRKMEIPIQPSNTFSL